MGVIYKITSPSGRIYIGKSKNLKKRIKDYKYQCEKRKSILHDSIRGYGWENHTLEIIEECEDDSLSEREIFWVKELNSYHYDNPKGMNMTRGGEAGGGSWIHDIERRKKQSERFKGEGGSFYGRKHTDEAKKTLSEKASKRHKERGTKIPEWGVEKGRMKLRKPIIIYNNSGLFISEFCSLSEGARKLHISLSSAKDSVLYGSWINGEYLFKYKTENYPLTIEVGEIKKQTVKRPVYWLSEDLEPICDFPSAKEASDFFGIPKTTINRAAQYNDFNPIRTGHIFCYKDEYLKEYSLVA